MIDLKRLRPFGGALWSPVPVIARPGKDVTKAAQKRVRGVRMNEQGQR